MKNFNDFIFDSYEYDNSGDITKILGIKNNFNLEIDPLGEEDWDDSEGVREIDWNKIKIKHPNINDAGKKVLLLSPKYGGPINNPDVYYAKFLNPKNTIGNLDKVGVVGEMGSNRRREGEPPLKPIYYYIVTWENGHTNIYGRTELTLIEI
jgi:hypothetical protein